MNEEIIKNENTAASGGSTANESPIPDVGANPNEGMMNGYPAGNLPVQPVIPVAEPVAVKKKSRRGLIIGIAAGAAAVIAVVVIILIVNLTSADARFQKAMEEKDYAKAAEILSDSSLKASEENDAHYLTLADLYADDYRYGKDDYESVVQKLIDLKSAEVYDTATTEKITQRETSVIESHIEGVYDAYCAGELDYDAAVAQIGASNPFGEEAAQQIADKYLSMTEEKRDEFYSEAIGNISSGTPEEIIASLEPFGDYRDAKTLIDVFTVIKDGTGVEAAKLLTEKQEQLEASADGVFDKVKSYILNRCFELSASEKKDYSVSIDNRLGESYARMLLGDDSWQVNNMFDSESIHAMTLAKKLDFSWFKSCKGGTGKIVFIPRYRSDTSWSDADEYYYYHIEDKKDIPMSKMPESLEDVEYVIVYDEGSIPYAEYSSSSGSIVKVYQRTVQVTVRQYPTGKVIYDSGVLKGAAPSDSITVFSGTKHAYGPKPDLTAVKEKVKKAVGLK